MATKEALKNAKDIRKLAEETLQMVNVLDSIKHAKLFSGCITVKDVSYLDSSVIELEINGDTRIEFLNFLQSKYHLMITDNQRRIEIMKVNDNNHS